MCVVTRAFSNRTDIKHVLDERGNNEAENIPELGTMFETSWHTRLVRVLKDVGIFVQNNSKPIKPCI